MKSKMMVLAVVFGVAIGAVAFYATNTFGQQTNCLFTTDECQGWGTHPEYPGYCCVESPEIDIAVGCNTGWTSVNQQSTSCGILKELVVTACIGADSGGCGGMAAVGYCGSLQCN